MTFVNRLSLEFFLPVQTFNFRNPYLALRWHSLRQVYPDSFLFNLPAYQGLLLTMSFPFHFSSFSGLCPVSFISRFESSLESFFFFFFQKGQGIDENLESVIAESSFGFTGERELTWEQDAQGKVYAGHDSGQKSTGVASRCDRGGFWAEAFGTVVRSARFPLPVRDHGSLGQASVCQPGSQWTSAKSYCQLNMSRMSLCDLND